MIAAAMKTAEEEDSTGDGKDKTIAELSSTVVQLREESKEKTATASAVTFAPQTEKEQRKAMCAQLSAIVGRPGKKKKGSQ